MKGTARKYVNNDFIREVEELTAWYTAPCQPPSYQEQASHQWICRGPDGNGSGGVGCCKGHSWQQHVLLCGDRRHGTVILENIWNCRTRGGQTIHAMPQLQIADWEHLFTRWGGPFLTTRGSWGGTVSAMSFLSQASTYESTYSASEVAAKVGFSIFGIGFGGSAGSSSSTLNTDGTFQSRLNTEAKVVGGSAEGLQDSSSQHGNIHDWTLEDWSSWIESVKLSPALIDFHVTRVCDLFDGDTRAMCNTAVDLIYGHQQQSLRTISTKVDELARRGPRSLYERIRSMFQKTRPSPHDCEWLEIATPVSPNAGGGRQFCPGDKISTGQRVRGGSGQFIRCCHIDALHWEPFSPRPPSPPSPPPPPPPPHRYKLSWPFKPCLSGGC